MEVSLRNKKREFHGNACYIQSLSACDANYCHLPCLVSVTTPQGDLHLRLCQNVSSVSGARCNNFP